VSEIRLDLEKLMPDLIWQKPAQYQAYKLRFAINHMDLRKSLDKNIAAPG
jgi:hypothetical protein